MTVRITGNDTGVNSLLGNMLHGREKPCGETLHKGRNTVKRHIMPHGEIAVKQFGNNTFKSLLHIVVPSKAEKSYHAAIRLTEMGIATPEPLAYGEARGKWGRLLDSAYASRYIESQSLEEALKSQPETTLCNFAKFASRLHSLGIIHNDLNLTNVRVEAIGRLQKFSLIDLNRTRFKNRPLNPDERFANLTRFSCLDSAFVHFLECYLLTSGLPKSMVRKAIKSKIRHDRKVDFNKKIKHLFKYLKTK